jgi:hypothetical protein
MNDTSVRMHHMVLMMCVAVLAVNPVRAQDPAQTQDPAQVPPSQLPRGNASPVAAVNPSVPYHSLDGHEKRSYYFRSTYGPVAVVKSLASSAWSQARDSNPEWGQGMEGYGRRFASKFGQHVVKRSFSQGLGAMLHEDPRYFVSERPGLLPRAGHAVAWTFMTRKDEGGYKFGDAKLAGTLAASLISRTWHPEESRNVRSGFENFGMSLAIDAGWNLFKEFWPDVRRRLHR